MKSHFYLLLFVFLVGVLLLPNQQVFAQTQSDTTNVIVGDTMHVAWAKTGFTPRDNALRNAIAGDTVAGGGRANANRVYKLKLDGFYWTSDDITNTGFHLRIVADKAGPGKYPPILQMRDTREADGSGAALHLITASDNVTLKNIFISGRTTATRAQTAYQPVIFGGSGKTYTIDGCVFEQSNFALVVFTGTNNNCVIVNNKFRNLSESPVTQQYAGRGISIWADQQSVIIENNTFFNVGFVTFQMEGGSAKYLRYNHNTIVNAGRGLMSNSGNWWQSAYFANNLIINGWWEGERYADVNASGRDPRQAHNGLFNIGPLPSVYGPAQSRRIVVTKNYAFLDPLIKAKYGSGGTDSIRKVWFMDPVSKLDYAIPLAVGGANDGHVYVGDTTWLTSLPTGMVNPLTDADWLKPQFNVTGATMVDSMWKWITNIYAGITNGTEVFYHPTVGASDQTWPLPENFVYTDAALKTAGTDGLPIGDLNYFPTEKATFEAGKAAFITQIEAKAGPVTVFTVDTTVQAESGILSGGAAIKTFQGFSYFQMDGGGSMEWKFNLANAGQLDMNVWTHMRNNDTRGQNTFLNGVSVHDSAFGYGELIYSNGDGPNAPTFVNPHKGMPINEWTWVLWKKEHIKKADQPAFNFLAGQNSIRITPSWGYQNFAGIDLLTPGTSTVVKSLRAPDITSYSIVSPIGEGAPWTPNGFKSVALGTNGTVTVTGTTKNSGNYSVQVFYQNASGPQSLVVKEGTTTLTTIQLDSKSDSTGLSKLSTKFQLTAGAHTLSFTGSNVNIDEIQLINVVTSVGGNDGLSPYSYSLEQNYPNPFNPSTTIKFALGKTSNVKLTVYNILGQNVATLVNNNVMDAGPHAVEFNASKLASGVYFYRIDAGEFTSVKKMMLIK